MIRDATSDDENKVREFLDEVIVATLDAQVHGVPAIVENVRQNVDIWMSHPQNTVHVIAEMDGQIVGSILVKDFWNFCSLFVHANHQRKGIGAMLVQAAVERCRGRSPHGALLMHANNEAIPFYEKLGFVTYSTTKTPPAGSTPMRLQMKLN